MAENLRPAKKLPPSPPKRPVREDLVKTTAARPGAMGVQAKGVKHALETEENKTRTANYTAAGQIAGQSQHGQDVKRRRTEENEDKEIITSKPMRVSVVKQVLIQFPRLIF